jgi:hypothetical protein
MSVATDVHTPDLLDDDPDAESIRAAIAVARQPPPETAPAYIPLALCQVCGQPATREGASLCALHMGITLDHAQQKAAVRAYLEGKAFRAAEDLVEASKNAAVKGNSGPAEFILLHTKMLEPVKGKVDGPGGVTINIGVVLPGCGARHGDDE